MMVCVVVYEHAHKCVFNCLPLGRTLNESIILHTTYKFQLEKSVSYGKYDAGRA